jgi:hypothetical protein
MANLCVAILDVHRKNVFAYGAGSDGHYPIGWLVDIRDAFLAVQRPRIISANECVQF